MTNRSEPSDRDQAAAWRSVLLAESRVVRAIGRDLEREGVIPLAWYDVLRELSRADDGQLRMQALGLRTVLSRTRVSRVVAEIEAKGLVERVPDPADNRATLATITTAGRAALETAAPVYQAGIEDHFNRYLTPTQRRAITRALRGVIDAHADQADPRR